MTHNLKTWPAFFEPVNSGAKPFEVRLNDRNYILGDILHLQEYEPSAERYTDRTATFRVTYILSNSPWLQPGYVVMGIARIHDAPSVPITNGPVVAPELPGERLTARVIDQTPATQTVEDIRGEKHVLTGEQRDWKAGVEDVGTLFIGTDGAKQFKA